MNSPGLLCLSASAMQSSSCQCASSRQKIRVALQTKGLNASISCAKDSEEPIVWCRTRLVPLSLLLGPPVMQITGRDSEAAPAMALSRDSPPTVKVATTQAAFPPRARE